MNEQNHNRALGGKEGVKNEDAIWEYEKKITASKSEIAWGQEILGGEHCHVPIQIRIVANNVSPTY